MPFQRVAVRNEYRLGKAEMFKGVSEDPKSVFDGVAVAGLVGLLRQLGDLAEFAAEVFHGLQEEVMTTSLRSRKLAVRVKQIESSLPTLEKVALAQKNHLHFCYTAGIDMYVHIQNQHNHFIHEDLPKFIMDSYEECREPPRLHLLDKFDSNGPGSCLKKYSDPTFFKKASPISDEAAYTAERDRRRLRRKKKRQGPKNREVQNLSISDGIARMQFVSTVGESPAHCISKNKTAPESGLEGTSESIELRAGPDDIDIDCVFNHIPSVIAKEEELKGPQSTQFTLQTYENFNSDFSDNKGKIEDGEYLLKTSLQYEPSSSSTRVSWEEKTEIVNCEDYKYLPDNTWEITINDSPDDKLETTATNLCDSEHLCVTSEGTSAECLTGLPEDLESDTEDFMDALNTIESETECESDYQAKQEAGFVASNVNISDSGHQSRYEPASLRSLNDGTLPYGTSSECIDPASLNGFMHEELPQVSAKNNIDTSMDILSCSHSENRDPLPTSVLVSEDYQQSPSETITNGAHDAHEPSSGSSEKCSNAFWTNGGLLGLQPSKPLVSETCVAGNNNNFKEAAKPIISAANGINATFCSDELTGAFKSSATEKTTDVSQQELDIMPPMSGLACTLFSSGFQRKLPSTHDYRSLPVGSPENDREQRSVTHKTFPERSPNKFSSAGFDVNSPSSSPPLEHMKISFLPVSSAEASHLKLKFRDEEINHELYGDLLPSFQLVPDSSVHPRANGADSDDDDHTFCRSPESRSDDNLQYCSESSSGRWESSDTPESTDQGFYDDMCRTPSVGESSLYNNPFDAPENELPNFDVIKSSVLTTESVSDLKESLTKLQLLNEAKRSPPPLPPSQWMSAKLQLNSISDQHDVVQSEDLRRSHSLTGFASLEHQNILSTWQPTILQVPANKYKVHETIQVLSTNKFQDLQKTFGKVKINEASSDFNDKDDFLQQIRTQSFNLRRTSLLTSTRSNSMPAAPITNAKVSAILEKANAIRQVVASDDGEDDDTWSE